MTLRAWRWLTASSLPGSPMATVGGPTPRTTHWARSRQTRPTRGDGRTTGPVISVVPPREPRGFFLLRSSVTHPSLGTTPAR